MWNLIRANRRRSIILITMMVVLVMGAGSLVEFPWGMFITAGVLAVLVGVYFRSAERFVLRGARGFPARRKDCAQLLNTVEEMCVASGLGFVPRILVLDDPAPNAFAVGRKPRSSTIVVTRGLVRTLTRDELQGVVAHEIAHIQNRDVQFMTLAAAMLGVAVWLALALEMLLRGNVWLAKMIGISLLDGSGSHSEMPAFVRWIRKEAPQLMLLVIPYVLALLALLVVALPFFLFGEMVQKILYFACSRGREFLADACAVQYTRYPEGLASALEKISNADVKPGFADGATVPLFIVNPFRVRWRGRFDRLFTTHPPTSERIAILRCMVGPNLGDYEVAYQQTTHRTLVLR